MIVLKSCFPEFSFRLGDDVTQAICHASFQEYPTSDR